MADLRCAAVDLSAVLNLGQLKLCITRQQYPYNGTSATFGRKSSTLPGRTCNIETLVTPAHAHFHSLCILCIT